MVAIKDNNNHSSRNNGDETSNEHNPLKFSHVINKVGTKKLCQYAKQNSIPVYCFVDSWKIWYDIYPPPIETKLFEIIPIQNMIDHVIVPN